MSFFGNIAREFTVGVQSAVSGHKYRFKDGEFDLDLSYITERIIAMAIPASGAHFWRNDAGEVARFLDKYHGSNYMIYNVSGRKTYEDGVFSHHVRHVGWKDHHAPPLLHLLGIISEADSFLSAKEENVCVIHCQAGKGRTGVIIVALLLRYHICNSVDEGLAYYAQRRSKSNIGVAVPSQIRYIRYYKQIYDGYSVNLSLPTPKELIGISFRNCPRSFFAGLHLSNMSTGMVIQKVYLGDFSAKNRRTSTKIAPIEIAGDIRVILTHQDMLGAQPICRVQFHTEFVASEACFPRTELDDAVKGALQGSFLPPGFEITLHIR